ncbi:MAG: hypothetical protein RL441_1505 [Actinomycetota bacterium]
MEFYLIAALAILGANLLPAFAPPAWSILVYFVLAKDLSPIPLIVLGVLAAGLGRYGLAQAFRGLIPRLPTRYAHNLENLGSQLSGQREKWWATQGLFFLAPLSSSQLFEAAGMMRKINLVRVTIAFMAGRLITYSAYVFGANHYSGTDFERTIIKSVASPQAVITQVLMVAGLVWLGRINWRPAIASADDSANE